jgi:hypothetical protein
MAKKLTKAEKIRRYLDKYPDATAKEVMSGVVASAPQVYGIMAKLKTASQQAPIPEKGFVDAKEKPAPKHRVGWMPATTKKPTTTDVAGTLKARGDKYGTFIGNATIAQGLKRVVYEHAKVHSKEFTDDQMEALDMICTKLGRIVNGDPNYADSWLDIAGYAKLVSDRLETGLIT